MRNSLIIAISLFLTTSCTSIKQYVKSNVVMITNEAKTGGGTGFHLVSPGSGKTYILTNAHVCQGVGDHGLVWVSDDKTGERAVPRRILEISSETDVCLVEPLYSSGGLKLGEDAEVGDTVVAVGHPRLIPTIAAKGEVLKRITIELVDHEITDQASRDVCKAPKGRIVEGESFFGHYILCVSSVAAVQSSILTYPGNSGSPVVDSVGHVVGIIFAGESSMNFGFYIDQSFIRTFLQPY